MSAIVAATVLGLAGVAGGLVMPRAIARIPEPEAEPVAPDAGAEPVAPAPEPKEPYADIAATPRLGGWLAVLGAVAGAAVGWSLGWEGALLPWAYLIPLGIGLGLIDWRTRLLPTRLIAPSYGVLVVLVLAAGAIDRDAHALLRALIGWAALGGLYLVLWLISPRSLGYGDVRLSGLLGMALGYLGWAQLLAGGYLGFLLGGFGGLLLSVLGIVDRKRFAFGPFMIAGALIAPVVAVPLAHAAGY